MYKRCLFEFGKKNLEPIIVDLSHFNLFHITANKQKEQELI